ncbi:hypothetical protein M8818_006505 [Zalaria obscura]|uniref:Uncharacterized protein n=1 Tax=Zalaria obscura TaxID=2024903 RepID=A0ACC3S6N1_9PEZI
MLSRGAEVTLIMLEAHSVQDLAVPVALRPAAGWRSQELVSEVVPALRPKPGPRGTGLDVMNVEPPLLLGSPSEMEC